VRRGGNQFRIDVQLIVVDEQTHVWSNSFTRDTSDILRVQSEVAAEVARQIEGALPVGLPKPPQVDPVAHDAYLRGRFSSSRQRFQQSIDSFNQALEKDPNYALAYAALAAAYASLGHSPYDAISPSEAKSAARLAAQRALDLNPSLSEAQAVMANLSMNYDWDLKTAEQEYQRAIELDPNEPTAHEWYGRLLDAEGHFNEALGEVRRALDIDPVSPLANTILAEPIICLGATTKPSSKHGARSIRIRNPGWRTSGSDKRCAKRKCTARPSRRFAVAAISPTATRL